MRNRVSPVTRLRLDAGLSQEDLARKCGLARITVNRLERGMRGKPSLETVSAVATALGVTVDELLEPAPAAKTRSRRRAKGAR